MSGQLRTLKNRIRSVTNTQKITRAMEMVAAAKLRRFQDTMVKARPFTEGLEALLKRLSRNFPQITHPFFETREEKKAGLVLITSDTGLCGSYNHDLVEMANEFLSKNAAMHGGAPLLIGVGKTGVNLLKRKGFPAAAAFTDIRTSRVEPILKELKETLVRLFIEKEVDAVYVVYSHFLTLSKYQPLAEKLLPLEKPAAENKNPAQRSEYIFEPSPEIIFQKLIPVYFEAKTRLIFLESLVSEQIARMQAMHQATENASEMVDSLVLLRNKARQAAITKEIIEVISGSQASKK